MHTLVGPDLGSVMSLTNSPQHTEASCVRVILQALPALPSVAGSWAEEGVSKSLREEPKAVSNTLG